MTHQVSLPLRAPALKPASGRAFGIHFRSSLPLPELEDLPGAADQDSVAIEWHPPRQQAPASGTEAAHFDGQALRLSVPAVCDFAVSPRRIDVVPVPGVEYAAVRPFLLGSAMGALLHVRGTLVLHGSAVMLPDGSAALFCGDSTAGKSTLAATLAQRGHTALADDLSAITVGADGRPQCLPGLARTKLWRDALERLGLADQAGPATRVDPTMDKHCLPVAMARQPAAVSRLYELQVDESSLAPLSFTPIVGIDKITAMLRHVYRPHYPHAIGRQNQLLAAVAALAPQVQMVRIRRPRVSDTLPAIVAWLRAHWTPAGA